MVDAVTRNYYREVQQPVWERLAEERLRVVEAKKKISGACYMTSSLAHRLHTWGVGNRGTGSKSVLHSSNSTTVGALINYASLKK